MLDTGGGNTDWQGFYKEIVEFQRPIVVLEFGLGEGSFFLVENCEELYSLEIIVREEQLGWAEYVRNNTNLSKHTIEEMLFETDEYSYTLEKKIEQIVKRIKPDFAFVDSGCHCRGEIVQFLMYLGVDTIMVHDTNFHSNEYGWYLIEDYKEKNYKKYRDESGQGTDVYTKDRHLLEYLKNY